MFKTKLLAMIVLGCSLFLQQASSAQVFMSTAETNYGTNYNVHLELDRANTVFVTMTSNSINLLINGTFYQFPDVEHFAVPSFNMLTIYDSNDDAHIEFNGPTFQTMWVRAFGYGGDDWMSNNTSMHSILLGGQGDDYLRGGFIWDSILGHGGNDTIEGRSGDDELGGGGGNDDMDGGSGNDIMHGGLGFDLVMGGPGSDYVSGNSYESYKWLGAGWPDGETDILSGGSGRDYFPHAYFERMASGRFSRKSYIEKDVISDFNSFQDWKREFEVGNN